MIDLNPNAPPPAPASNKSSALVGVVLLACIAAFAGGVFVANLWEQATREGDSSSEIVQEQEETFEDTAPEADVEYAAQEGVLSITWLGPDEQTTADYEPVIAGVLCFGLDGYDLCQDSYHEAPTFVQLGTVAAGVYEGYSLDMVTSVEEGMGKNYTSYYILRKVGQPIVLLDRHARTTVDWLPTSVQRYDELATATNTLGEFRVGLLDDYVIETQAFIPELVSMDDSVVDAQGREYLFTGYWVRLYSNEAISLTSAKRTTTLENGQELYLYEPKEGPDGALLGGQTGVGRDQFYLIDEDGRVVFYDLKVPFFTYEKDADGNRLISQGIPNVTWNDGTKNEQIYMKGNLGGCGFTNATKVIDQETIDTFGLVESGQGTAPNGSRTKVYEPSSYEAEYFANAFNAVTFTYPDEEPKTYADFKHPYVYFQDSSGRWVELANYELIPPVECGKPVIYLYPESTMDMSVWVRPRGGFSYTEPEFGDGWEVTAYPDGRLVNREDGLEYPYLFWEGRGGLYPQVQTYWVVDRTGVEPFLRETLDKMNFNQSEVDDFVEFWLPRMQSEPFYKIGFHGTSVMNQLAPLSFSVKPDHLFRILMDYEGLDVWRPSKPPVRLPKANRDGFEVMEWGGVLR